MRPTLSTNGIETVMLVEDDVAVRELAGRVLRAHSYTVLSARDGAEALTIEASQAGDIHLLLTDVLMPELRGPDLAQRLVRRRPAMKVMLALSIRDLLDRPKEMVGQASLTG